MGLMREVVYSADVFYHVDRAFPDLTQGNLAKLIGRDESCIRRYRRQEIMRFESADHLLSALDLSYLLSTGDIPSHFRDYGYGAGQGDKKAAKKGVKASV